MTELRGDLRPPTPVVPSQNFLPVDWAEGAVPLLSFAARAECAERAVTIERKLDQPAMVGYRVHIVAP